MPGAPNRPPETAPAPAAPVPTGLGGAARKSLRRLAPLRVALTLDLWKGVVPADIFAPFDRAEKAFEGADYPGAENALDQVAVRLAEPRWPTLPLPFRDLRQTIAQPQPPSWDPESALPPADRDARRAQRFAESQMALVTSSLEWAKGHGIDVASLEPHGATARSRLAAEGASEAFWTDIDAVWTELRPLVPRPRPAAARPAPPPASADAAESA